MMKSEIVIVGSFIKIGWTLQHSGYIPFVMIDKTQYTLPCTVDILISAKCRNMSASAVTMFPSLNVNPHHITLCCRKGYVDTLVAAVLTNANYANCYLVICCRNGYTVLDTAPTQRVTPLQWEAVCGRLALVFTPPTSCFYRWLFWLAHSLIWPESQFTFFFFDT